jgi:hypothetical protein
VSRSSPAFVERLEHVRREVIEVQQAAANPFEPFRLDRDDGDAGTEKALYISGRRLARGVDCPRENYLRRFS